MIGGRRRRRGGSSRKGVTKGWHRVSILRERWQGWKYSLGLRQATSASSRGGRGVGAHDEAVGGIVGCGGVWMVQDRRVCAAGCRGGGTGRSAAGVRSSSSDDNDVVTGP
jgi:hypothetical protein